MLHFDTEYVPTLAIRPSEMLGLEKLPGATKDRLLPCFLLAPWANSKKLEGTINRIERAYANRPYILDIDRDYLLANDRQKDSKNLQREALIQFDRILDPSDAFAHWRHFVEVSEHIWPCVQVKQLDLGQVTRQIDGFRKAGRKFCLRMDRHRPQSNFPDVVEMLSESGMADFIVILEGGWSRDALTLESWFSNTVSIHLRRFDSQIPVVVSCTSMPVQFADMSGITPVKFSNRELVDRVSRQHNHLRFFYGDWASTRPRTTPGFASKPVDRIDYPTKDTWHIARNKKQSWGFQEASMEIINNTNIWNGQLKVWGEDMIVRTATAEEYGIASAARNVASRVNIHLHLQAFYNEDDLQSINFDEDWED